VVPIMLVQVLYSLWCAYDPEFLLLCTYLHAFSSRLRR
jgi:hypothetical protein